MQRNRVDAHTEKQIVTALVTSDAFLDQISSVMDVELLQAEHARLIAKWCLLYHEKYGKAPQQNIESIYNHWVGKGQASDDVIDAVQTLLENLSDEYDGQVNVPYLIDIATNHLCLRRIEVLKEDLETALLSNDKEAAESALDDYRTVDVQTISGIDVFHDGAAWSAAFEDTQKPLIQWGDRAADKFFGSALGRDSLIGILAPEKRGKTMWCVEFAIRALMNRRRVALFEVGDMSQSQILKRFGVRFSNRPLYKNQCNEPIPYPSDIVVMDGIADVDYRYGNVERPMSLKSSKEGVRAFMRRFGLSLNTLHYMLSVHPNSSINVAGIQRIMDRWEREKDFIADVIIIDYPDILDVESNAKNMIRRDQINETWKALRRLSQTKHCLVIAPTQSDAASYNADVLNMGHFSDDKRKVAHMTGLIGLNQTTEEKEKQVMRLNWVALRENDFSTERCLHVGQCFTLSRAFCCAGL